MPGIVRILAIPHCATPAAIRQLLSHHGTIDRIYLKPENNVNAMARAARTNEPVYTRYIDGYVEFADASQAKFVCQILNGRSMSYGLAREKKSRFSRYVWRLAHMPNMQWTDINYEHSCLSRSREAIIRAELATRSKNLGDYLLRLQRTRAKRNMSSSEEESSSSTEEDGPGYRRHPVIRQRGIRCEKGRIDCLLGLL
ncbi:Hypothetical protein GLP15_1131 [Giardia lamblia P15]|uniref:Ankyrin repeat protein n=1 Tax=Giardia intestinalis (strain P15) TaxID=658858 RepID=E1F8K4_GIAIA|nr:Hypothetical protein GLP15_1131 [Giardia lamblia P15]